MFAGVEIEVPPTPRWHRVRGWRETEQTTTAVKATLTAKLEAQTLVRTYSGPDNRGEVGACGAAYAHV